MTNRHAESWLIESAPVCGSTNGGPVTADPAGVTCPDCLTIITEQIEDPDEYGLLDREARNPVTVTDAAGSRPGL